MNPTETFTVPFLQNVLEVKSFVKSFKVYFKRAGTRPLHSLVDPDLLSTMRDMWHHESSVILEGLQFPSGRKSTFGEPNQILFVFENDGAEGEASASRACGLDRQNFP